MAKIYVGISGWRYAPWRGIFYPPNLTQGRELEFASRALPTIEINGSFYSLQRPGSYARWYRETPPGFLFAVKGGRYITHMRRLLVHRSAAPVPDRSRGGRHRGKMAVSRGPHGGLRLCASARRQEDLCERILGSGA